MLEAKYQDFYDQNSNSSPMVDNLMNFINSHSWYNYLNEYLNKQISTILFILCLSSSVSPVS